MVQAMTFPKDLLEQANYLARRERRKPKQASLRRTVKEEFSGQSAQTVMDLQKVADAFIRLQDFRHKADYDNTFTLTHTEALRQIALASDAFASWSAIRKERLRMTTSSPC
jgi:hypothetical protein